MIVIDFAQRLEEKLCLGLRKQNIAKHNLSTKVLEGTAKRRLIRNSLLEC